jgi:hypothetical protein
MLRRSGRAPTSITLGADFWFIILIFWIHLNPPYIYFIKMFSLSDLIVLIMAGIRRKSSMRVWRIEPLYKAAAG